MLIVISPAKKLDFETKAEIAPYTLPDLLDEAEKLAVCLRKMSGKELSELMGISTALGNLNYERYQTWHRPFTPQNAKQAVLAFNGDVYAGLDASSLPEETLVKAQKKLRILSGLYGVLKPLDLIQPYRLEMGSGMAVGKANDLYAFWKEKITRKIGEAIHESGRKTLVNLASNEYFKSIDTKKLEAAVVTPAFKDMKNGEYKVISIYAKKARGLMTRFILENNIEDKNDLQAFNDGGYHFNARMSTREQPVFTRG